MKTAILIMAHDQPNHLAKMVEYLSCDWTKIFIHIDRKVNINQYRRCIAENDKIIFLNDADRIRINWGGFSQVRATLFLLESSLNSGEYFDRFCFLSGSDFPIKPLKDIKVSFDSDKEFIRIDGRLDGSEHDPQFERVKYIHYMDYPFSRLTEKLLKMPRKVFSRIRLYRGSPYWSLTNGCVGYIIEFLQCNKDYISFLKHTKCPDEIFFHSIVKSSPFAENITQDFERADQLKTFLSMNVHGCHYIDWTTKGVRLPKVLNESDIINLLNSEALFARKFQVGKIGPINTNDRKNHLPIDNWSEKRTTTLRRIPTSGDHDNHSKNKNMDRRLAIKAIFLEIGILHTCYSAYEYLRKPNSQILTSYSHIQTE